MTSTAISVGHLSMQAQDSREQKEHDAWAAFKFANKLNLRWLMGTEAGPGDGSTLAGFLRAAAVKYDYHFFRPRGQACWVAVQKSFVATRAAVNYQKIIDGVAGQYPDKGVVAVDFDTRRLGHFNLMPGHFVTRGRPNAVLKEQGERLAINKEYMAAISDWAVDAGRGRRNTVWYSGDQNIEDDKADTFLGELPFISCWDELDRYPSTGHGTIDVIARSRRDKRVRCLSARAISDRELRLFTDHKFIVARYSVGHIE